MKLMTADQVADRLAVPVGWVYRAARDGVLPCVRLGRYVRFEREAIDKWIRDGGRGS